MIVWMDLSCTLDGLLTAEQTDLILHTGKLPKTAIHRHAAIAWRNFSPASQLSTHENKTHRPFS